VSILAAVIGVAGLAEPGGGRPRAVEDVVARATEHLQELRTELAEVAATLTARGELAALEAEIAARRADLAAASEALDAKRAEWAREEAAATQARLKRAGVSIN
jgi:hypothetical protein